MDPNPEQSRVSNTHGSLLRPGSATTRSPSLRPPSHATPGAVSFHAVSESGGADEYFPPFPDDSSSWRQGAPASSPGSELPATAAVTSSDDRPATSRAWSQTPSIRIRLGPRRRSNLSTATRPRAERDDPAANPLFDHIDHGLSGRPSGSQGGRTRSVSEPDRAYFDHQDGLSIASRHPRRLPQAAMPRLTEEGSPHMSELGFALSSPMSPAISAPENSSQTRRHSGRRRHTTRSAHRYFWQRAHDEELSPLPDAGEQGPRKDEYDERMADWLDVVDPEVQTLSTLTNIQNSLFVPELGRWVNRRPTYVLSGSDGTTPEPDDTGDEGEQRVQEGDQGDRGDRGDQEEAGPAPDIASEKRHEAESQHSTAALAPTSVRQRSTTAGSITSKLTDSHYATLPHGTTLEGWTAAEKLKLDDHVRHMLHSRRSKFRRRMKGFGQYVRRPLGFFVTLYATLITLFGLGWVLFLIGWIKIGNEDEQRYAIHVISSVLVALFAIMGDCMAPFRTRDTYHMVYIWRLERIVQRAREGKPPKPGWKPWRLQKRGSSPEVSQENAKTPAPARPSSTIEPAIGESATTPPPDQAPLTEIYAVEDHAKQGEQGAEGEHGKGGSRDINQHDPTNQEEALVPPANITTNNNTGDTDRDLEDTKPPPDHHTCPNADPDYLSALTTVQQKTLAHHQQKFAKSHSFYKPHETFTHYTFPLSYLVAVVILLDFHSALQITLSACTWGIDYRTRPFALTTVILCVSITCNIAAGVVITVGGRKTRKDDVAKLMKRQELTSDAMRTIERKRGKERGEKEGTGEEGDKGGEKKTREKEGWKEKISRIVRPGAR